MFSTATTLGTTKVCLYLLHVAMCACTAVVILDNKYVTKCKGAVV